RDRDLVEPLIDEFRRRGHAVLRPDKIPHFADVFSESSAAIRSADVVIAILTPGNASVYYEVGIASGAGVPILITAPGEVLIPSDLASVPYVRLTGDVARDAQTIIRRAEQLEGLATTRKDSFDTAEAALQAASRDPAVLEALGPAEFERLLAQLFRERGYEITEADRARHSTIDLVLKSPKEEGIVLVEIKKLARQSRVSVEAVRELLEGVIGMGASAGLLVSTSGFTTAALGLAAGTPIVLRTLEQILAAKSKRELLEKQ
ncbi:MAG TPA: restriction endonuclease, partial [Stellaceae bacterium]